MIQIVKLINGEEIIGDVEGDFSEFYNIFEPFNITYVDEEKYGVGVKLDYILAFSQNNCVTIKNNSVLYSYIPSKNMTEYYKKLVEYKNEQSPEEMIEKTIKDMEDMDRQYRELISRKIRRNEDLN